MLVLDTDALSLIQRGSGRSFDSLSALLDAKDLRIAAIVLSHDAVLVTGNLRDFEKIPMLQILPISSRA